MHRTLTIALFFLVSSGAFGQGIGQNTWIGVWTLNVAKSKSQDGPLPKSNTIRFEAVGDGIKVTNDWVNSVDIPTHTEFTARYDGKSVTVQGLPPGSTVALTRIDRFKLDVIQQSATGVTATAHYVVSRDGKTLTVNEVITNVDGLKLTNHSVFDRQSFARTP
jgi:hypothetical protein